MKDFIEVKNVDFSYVNDDEKVDVLKNFSIGFEKGSFTAVLGRNGCGKSTIAKLLNGILKASSGEVLVNGMTTANEEDDFKIKRTVGMVFQNPDNQIVATIVEEDVAFGLENIGVPRDEMEKRVNDALEAVNMLSYKEKSTGQLSGGQKQRVAIAGIIAMQPECIVFDEPTAMLDPKGRKEVIDVILKLCKELGITVILITHFMDEAALADRVVVINDGNIVIDDKPSVVFSDVETVKSCGLDVPQTTELIYQLNKNGYDLPKDILSVEKCVDVILDALL